MLFSGLSVRPDGARRSQGAVVGSIFGLAATLCCIAPAWATTLTVTDARVRQSNGVALPGSFNAQISAQTLINGETVLITGGIGPLTRLTWTNAGVSTVRFSVAGGILNGVEAGDDVRFFYDMTISASAGTVSWITRGTAAAPPNQGFTLGHNGTVPAGEHQIIDEFGRRFTQNSTGNGDYSMYIDISWFTSNPNATLEVKLNRVLVHLPSPGTAAAFALLGAGAIRRRR